jgi:very-short-patch-repair endonuclease
VRDHALGVHIRRQHVLLGRFIADFYCARVRVCIEIDGDTHVAADQADYDAARTSLLEAHGYRVMRFTNAEVIENLEGVVQAIQEACEVHQ